MIMSASEEHFHYHYRKEMNIVFNFFVFIEFKKVSLENKQWSSLTCPPVSEWKWLFPVRTQYLSVLPEAVLQSFVCTQGVKSNS